MQKQLHENGICVSGVENKGGKHYQADGKIDIFCFPHDQWKEHVRDGAWAKVSAVNKLPLTFCGADFAAARGHSPSSEEEREMGKRYGRDVFAPFRLARSTKQIRHGLTQRIRTITY